MVASNFVQGGISPSVSDLLAQSEYDLSWINPYN